MAGFDPINYVGFQNPAAALKLQQQQALAAQLMKDGEPRADINAVASPGPYGQVSRYSPLEGLSKALSQGIGGYMQGQNNAELAKMLQRPDPMTGATNAAIDVEGGMGPATKPDVAGQYQQQLSGMLSGGQGNTPTMQEMQLDAYSPGLGKAAFEERMKLQNAGAIKAEETKNTPYVTPQGTYQMGSQIMGGNAPTAAAPQLPPALQSGGMASPQGGPVPLSTDLPAPGNGAPANMDDLLNNYSAPSAKSDAPLAADGKPLLPGLANIPPADPSGTPKFKTENTNTGVEQTKQDIKDVSEGSKAFANMAQNLTQEKARLDNLTQVYKDVQSGTLTAQNPEFFNKMAALGFNDSPEQIKALGGIQRATQNHILQIIAQMKDTNATLEGPTSRIFGATLNKLTDEGESAKDQPEALWHLIGEAKGAVDNHLDMLGNWQKYGGAGNRLAGGYTMRPTDFATQFLTNHNITDYRDKALKDMGPFKGMAGNNDASPSTKTLNGVTYTKINGKWHQ